MKSCPIISIVSELRHAHCCMSSYQSNSRSCVGTTRVGVKVQMTQFIGSLLSLSLLLYELWYQMKSPIMFRHMPVPRDKSVSRLNIIVCCESAGNCQTLSKDGPSQLVNSIIFRPFFCSLCPMSIVSYQFCTVPTCAHHVFCTLFSCLSIDSSLYHVIFSDM